jgi:hypothetical protein
MQSSEKIGKGDSITYLDNVTFKDVFRDVLSVDSCENVEYLYVSQLYRRIDFDNLILKKILENILLSR